MSSPLRSAPSKLHTSPAAAFSGITQTPSRSSLQAVVSPASPLFMRTLSDTPRPLERQRHYEALVAAVDQAFTSANASRAQSPAPRSQQYPLVGSLEDLSADVPESSV